MDLAARLGRIQPSATLTINARAQELRAQGREITSLAVGEPDFSPPQHILDAAKQAVDDKFTRYTPVPGMPELRTEVAGYFRTFNGVEAKADAVMVSNGGKQVLYNLCMALLNPGDQVLVPGPYWVSYPAMVALAEGQTVVVPASAQAGYKVSVDDLEAARTPKSRILILNTPCNPTGRHYSQEELDDLVEWAVAHDIFVIADEVYDRLVYAPAQPASASHLWVKHPEHVAVVGALSKTFAMTGWRFGFVLARPKLIKAMTKLQSQSTSNVCSIVQRAALAAFTGSWGLVEDMKRAFVRRRDLVLEVVSTWPGAVCPLPEGAFYAFPNLWPLLKGRTSVELCTQLLDEAGVALVPGAAFGDDACVRISYAVDDDTLADALDKIGTVLKK